MVFIPAVESKKIRLPADSASGCVTNCLLSGFLWHCHLGGASQETLWPILERPLTWSRTPLEALSPSAIIKDCVEHTHLGLVHPVCQELSFLLFFCLSVNWWLPDIPRDETVRRALLPNTWLSTGQSSDQNSSWAWAHPEPCLCAHCVNVLSAQHWGRYLSYDPHHWTILSDIPYKNSSGKTQSSGVWILCIYNSLVFSCEQLNSTTSHMNMPKLWSCVCFLLWVRNIVYYK